MIGIGRVVCRSDQAGGVGQELRVGGEVERAVGVVEDAGHHVAGALVSVEFVPLVPLQPIRPEKNHLLCVARQSGCGEAVTG